jgi:hypothetical protein
MATVVRETGAAKSEVTPVRTAVRTLTLVVGEDLYSLVGETPGDDHLVKELLPCPLTTKSVIALLVEACRDQKVKLVIRTDQPPLA